ncbi:MAG: class I SAM-dependent methyltransferase [Actinomycetota bacterium]|nr:class I SAM-dependent methyltransferase [Actinomycetota bacterium]
MIDEQDPEARLAAYAELVRGWAPRLDLIAPGDLDRLEERHLDDSLKALEVVRAAPPGLAVDVGSGAGLPGVPLAIAAPGRRWRLLEPRAKRAGFLDQVVRELELNAEVIRMSAQQAARDPALAGVHALATARALTAPAVAFDLLAPLLAASGISLVWVGERARIPSGAEELVPGLAIIRRDPIV